MQSCHSNLRVLPIVRRMKSMLRVKAPRARLHGGCCHGGHMSSSSLFRIPPLTDTDTGSFLLRTFVLASAHPMPARTCYWLTCLFLRDPSSAPRPHYSLIAASCVLQSTWHMWWCCWTASCLPLQLEGNSVRARTTCPSALLYSRRPEEEVPTKYLSNGRVAGAGTCWCLTRSPSPFWLWAASSPGHSHAPPGALRAQARPGMPGS